MIREYRQKHIEKAKQKMKKAFIASEGEFGTNWTFDNGKVFLTKKSLHKYMKKSLGFGCPPKKTKYHDVGEHFSNENEQYGYNIEEIEIVME